MRHNRHVRGMIGRLLAATVMSSLVPAAALAQAAGNTDAAPAPAATPAATADEASGGEVVVTGFRQSYANAISTKRNSVAITDGISSDGLGRFPDLNVGEALQRVPGVQINREAEGRNATINLRGLPGEYARLTFNGVAFAEPILTEAAPLGAFNSDIFSAIMIDKSPLANAQTGGLSGNIDLQIAPALGRKEGGFAKASYEYNELGKMGGPAATFGYNHHFTDNFAVFGVFAYKHENFRRDSILFNSYSPLTAAQAQANAALVGQYYAKSTACQSCTGTTSTAGVIYNSQTRQYSRLNEGNLYSGAAGAEWRPTDSLRVGVTGFYTDRKLPKTVQYLSIISNNASSSITALSAPVKLADGRYVINDFSFSNPDGTASTRLNGQHQKAWGVNGNAEWKKDDWRFSTVVTASKASNSSLENQIDMDTIQITGGNGITGTLHTGGSNLDAFNYTLSPSPYATLNAPNGWFWGGVSDPTSLYDSPTAANRKNRIQFTGTQSYATNSLHAIQADLERTFVDSPLSGIQVGVRYESNKFVSQGYRTSAFGLQTQNLKPSMAMTSPTADDFFGNLSGATTNWPVVDAEAFLAAVKPVTVYPGGALSPLGFNIRYSDTNYALYNFSNKNSLIEGYAQLKYEFEVGTVRVRGNGGIRFERTKNEIDALDRLSLTGTIGSPSDFKPVSFNSTYNKWLPSFILVADLTDKLVLRGAAYRTYVRPQPRQFTPVTVISPPSGGTYTLTLGNPNLKPYDSTSFDVSLEWYNRPGGIVSVAAFQKRVTGIVTQITDPKRLCPADATAFGLGRLTVVGDQCQSDILYQPNGPGGPSTPYLIVATGNINSTSPITVRGLEFNVNQAFDFLPGILKNLGGGVNYAYTTLKGNNANGTAATLPGVSKHNVNVIGYYETPDYGLRLVFNMRSKYDLASAGTFTGAARQVKARGQLDLSASYNITEAITASFDAYNLTNARRIEYENQPGLPRRADFDGRTYTFTLRANF